MGVRAGLCGQQCRPALGSLGFKQGGKTSDHDGVGPLKRSPESPGGRGDYLTV